MISEYLPAILSGSVTTIMVAVSSMLLAFIIGLIGATMKLSANPVIRVMAQAYTSIARGLPDMVMMLLVFYGGQVLLNNLFDNLIERQWLSDSFEYPQIDPFVAGVITLSFIFGAYFTETLRGAFLTVPGGQTEAATACGMTRWQTFHRILFPQMMRHALPGIGNNWLVLLKSTAIVSLIGLADMTFIAMQAGSTTHKPFIFYLIVCLLYLLMTFVSSRALVWMETKYNIGVKPSMAQH